MSASLALPATARPAPEMGTKLDANPALPAETPPSAPLENSGTILKITIPPLQQVHQVTAPDADKPYVPGSDKGISPRDVINALLELPGALMGRLSSPPPEKTLAQKITPPAPTLPPLQQVAQAKTEPVIVNSPGIIIRRETMHIPPEPGVEPPAPTLREHLTAIIPAVTRETIEAAQKPAIEMAAADVEVRPFAELAPASGNAVNTPAANTQLTPLIELPATDKPEDKPKPVVETAPVPPPAAPPVQTPPPPNHKVVVVIEPPEEPPVAKPAVKSKAKTKTAKKTPEKKKPPVETAAPVAIPETPAVADANAPTPQGPTLSPESRKILSEIPSGLDKKPVEKAEHLKIQRAQETGGPKGETIAKHEALGIKIEIKTPKMDTNYELRKAYDAQALGQYSAAIDIYKSVLNNEPGNTQALLGLATSYQRIGQVDQARPLYGKLLAIDPNNRGALNNFLGLLANEAPQEAAIQLEALSQRNPDSSTIPAQLAVIYQKLGDLDKAGDKMTRAIELEPGNLTYRYNLAILLDKQHKYDGAAALYQQLLAANDRGEVIPGNIQKIQQRLTFIRSNKP